MISSLLLVLLCACAGAGAERGKTKASREVRQAVDEDGAVVATEKAVANASKEDVVCRREYTIGSHIPKRVCRTVGEIEKAAEQTQDSMNRNINRGCAGGLSCSGN